MKGVILAGGTGSRLFPSTRVTNKHLLPVFNRPMISYPINTLKNSGVRDILIITSTDNAGDFLRLLGSGAEYGVNLTYKIQDGAGGIAQALSLAEDFAHDSSVAVILSDNIYEDEFATDVLHFKSGAHIFIKEVEDPERFGVVEVDENGIVRSIEEKPSLPKSNWAQTGLFLYDNNVFDYIREVEPSLRGELEISDVNNIYLRRNELKSSRLYGMWIDAGTHDSLLEASILAQEAFDPERVKQRRTHRQIIAPKREVSHKIVAGIISHNSEKYIAACLESLQEQNYDNFEIVVLDNASKDNTVQIIQEKFPSVKLIRSTENIGFARGHNSILRETESDFYACINVDMMLEPSFIAELHKNIDQQPTFGSATGKLKFWDFPAFERGEQSKGKTNFLDTVGLRILKSHRFEDIGQGEVDYGQYDAPRETFGASGAAVLYRRAALDDVSFDNVEGQKEFFDEAMFLYKEDIDLAYRLQWAGWKCSYTPAAIGYHDRTVGMKSRRALDIIRNRIKKSKQVNRYSFLNHRILLEKNFSSAFSADVRGATFWYNSRVFLYILIFETELLSEWWKIFRMRKRLKAWKSSMPRRVSRKEIEKLMEG